MGALREANDLKARIPDGVFGSKQVSRLTKAIKILFGKQHPTSMADLLPGLILNIPALNIALTDAGWKSTQPLFVPSGSLNPVVTVSGKAFSSLQPVSDALTSAHAEISQLKFLLASAPMMDAPDGDFDMSRINVPFVYIHPKTLAKLETTCGKLPVRVRGAKTKWVPISLMPEGRVIYSPLPIPGLEKILAE